MMTWINIRSCFCCVCVHLSVCACGIIRLAVKLRRVTSESQSSSSAPRGQWSLDADASSCAGDLRSSLHGRNRWTQSAGCSAHTHVSQQAACMTSGTLGDSPPADVLACPWPPSALSPWWSQWFPPCPVPQKILCYGVNRKSLTRTG